MLTAVLLTATRPARAETAEEAAGKAMFAEGNQFFASGDYVGALERFQGALARTNNPKVMLNLGTTYRHLGRFAEAASSYDAYLKHPKADPTKRAEVEGALRDVLVKVATLRIAVEGDGRVLVDAREVGKGPGSIQVRVDRGGHTILMEDGKGPPVSAQVDVVAGEERVVLMRREPPAATPASATPTAGVGPSAGGAGWPTSSYVLMGVGAGILVGGGVLAKLSADKFDDARQHEGTCRALPSGSTALEDGNAKTASSNDTATSYERFAWGGAALGLATVGAGLWVGLSSDSRSSRSTRVKLSCACQPPTIRESRTREWLVGAGASRGRGPVTRHLVQLKVGMGAVSVRATRPAAGLTAT